jgi:hypothetical protein
MRKSTVQCDDSREVPAEAYESAAASLRRLLQNAPSLEDYTSAFSAVLKLTGRNTIDEDACAAARTEYHDALVNLHRQLPQLAGWLLAEKGRLQSQLACEARVQEWLQANRQTR